MSMQRAMQSWLPEACSVDREDVLAHTVPHPNKCLHTETDTTREDTSTRHCEGRWLKADRSFKIQTGHVVVCRLTACWLTVGSQCEGQSWSFSPTPSAPAGTPFSIPCSSPPFATLTALTNSELSAVAPYHHPQHHVFVCETCSALMMTSKQCVPGWRAQRGGAVAR